MTISVFTNLRFCVQKVDAVETSVPYLILETAKSSGTDFVTESAPMKIITYMYITVSENKYFIGISDLSA